MKPISLISLFLLCHLVLISNLHAEGGCPPGMIPYSGTNISSCAPIPNYTQGSDEQTTTQFRWLPRWGAVATDGTNWSVGEVTGMESQRQAKKAAIADCKRKGGSKCKIQVLYANGCAALILGDKIYNTNSAANLKEAIDVGMKMCRSEDTNCHVYYSACSPPLQIK